MINLKHTIDNQEGSAIVFVLIMLVLVMMIGVSSNQTSTTESLIVRNEELIKQNLYQAERPAKILLTKIARAADQESTQDKINANSGTKWDYIQDENYKMDDTDLMKAVSEAISATETTSRYAAKHMGVSAGAGAGMDQEEHYHDYDVHGLSITEVGTSHVKMGFRIKY